MDLHGAELYEYQLAWWAGLEELEVLKEAVTRSLKAGDVRVVIGQDDGAKGWDRVKGGAMSLQITTNQNIDEIANRARAAGGVLVAEPTETPWGARMFRIKDPDGFIFVISSQ